MSPTVGNFVHDLVEMAKAMETLPLVQAELERLQQQRFEDGERIARLERTLIDRANEMDALYAKLRSVEAERDDASFRQLEAEDKVVSVIREVGALQAALRGIEMTLNPPAPEPILDPGSATPYIEPIYSTEPKASEAQVAPSWVSEPVQAIVPITAAEPTETLARSDQSPDWSGPNTQPEPQGERASDPTIPVPTGSEKSEQTSVTSFVPQDATSDTEPKAPKPGKYHGRRYYDIPVYISLTEWLNGGGSVDDYHWRPEPKVAS